MQNLNKPMALGQAMVDDDPINLDEVEIEVVSRPDGYYWIAPDGRQEFGPFESREEARLDSDRASEEIPEPGESVQEAEDEIGIADWIDPDTSEPAEGRSAPRLGSE